MTRLFAFATVLGLLWPLAAASETGDAYALEAEIAATLIAEAGARLQAAPEGEGRLAALGAAVTAYEAGLSAIRGGLRILAAREAQLEADIAARRRTYRDMLGVILMLERTPPPALLTHPLGPVGQARAARLMAGLAPALDAKTAELRGKLDELREIRTRQHVAQAELRTALAGLQAARAELAAALRARQKPRAPAVDLDGIARNAGSLSAFAEALRATGPAGGADASFSLAKGALPPPMAGARIVLGFGEADETGEPIGGLRLTAPGYALVTAPWSATIRYAGELANYGNVVILEPEEGYLLVLAGMARMDRLSGETVHPGEPLGQLGAIEPDSEEFLVEATSLDGTISQETLYMELRANGVPEDPATWFAFAE